MTTSSSGLGHLIAGCAPAQFLRLQMFLNLQPSLEHPLFVLNRMQISSPPAECVAAASGAGPSLDWMLLRGRKNWLFVLTLAGFGEKHQMKISSLYLSQRSVLSLAACCLKQRSYSKQASAGYHANQHLVIKSMSSFALYGYSSHLTPRYLFQASNHMTKFVMTHLGCLGLNLEESGGNW